MRSRAFWSALVMCACAPGAARAQLPSDTPAPLAGSRILLPYTAPGFLYGGYPYGYAAPIGPSGVGAFGFYVPRGFWPNGLSVYGPPVPVPGAIPGVFGNYDLTRNWQAVPFNGVGPYGAVGVFATFPRPRYLAAPSLPTVEGLPPGPAAPLPRGAKPGGCVYISVKVPQPTAEVFVNGKRTVQSGTDRIYQSPPLEAGETYKYVVTVRWVERGQIIEMSKDVSAAPGEVARVIFDPLR
jgi:uncharacterized protein (TIGR03000 family)